MSIRSQEQVALLTDFDPSSAYSNAYYTLYTNIRSNWESDKPDERSEQGIHAVHTLLLATPAASAEYATAAANIAIVAAQSGTPAVLVDADLRSAGLEQRFGLSKHAGWSDLLNAQTITTQNIADALQTTFVPGLRLLGAGTADVNTATLLSAKLGETIACLRRYLAETESGPSLVVFNSAPVLASPEAALIGAEVAQTLLTIVKGRTTRTQARQAQEQLERAHVHPAGLVVLEM